MEWTKITEENKGTIQIGEAVRYHNGYCWAHTDFNEFIRSRGFIITGIGSETANLINPTFGGGTFVKR
jgi:hypothetical protein